MRKNSGVEVKQAEVKGPGLKVAAEKGGDSGGASRKQPVGAKALMILRHLWHATPRVPRSCPDTRPSRFASDRVSSAFCEAVRFQNRYMTIYGWTLLKEAD